MAKYIRTKDGIYKNEGVIQSNSIYDEPSILVCGGHRGVNIKNIIKQSDNIEELFDEFVVCYKNKTPFTSVCWSAKELLKEHDLSECEVYGAIWTDKGLIYVAKMNKEGRWELL